MALEEREEEREREQDSDNDNACRGSRGAKEMGTEAASDLSLEATKGP